MHLLCITNVFLTYSVNYSVMEFAHENITAEIKHGMRGEENIRKYIRILINCITNISKNHLKGSEKLLHISLYFD